MTHNGYVLVNAPDSEHAYRNEVLEHIAVAERTMGHALPAGAQVHHVDGDSTNNENSNLVVCQDDAYHKLLHQRTRALDECGHAHWLKCVICGVYDAPENLYVCTGKKHWGRHRACHAAREAARVALKRCQC